MTLHGFGQDAIFRAHRLRLARRAEDAPEKTLVKELLTATAHTESLCTVNVCLPPTPTKGFPSSSNWESFHRQQASL